jgi:hypothetical protein
MIIGSKNMSKRRKIKLLLIITLIFIITMGCDLLFPVDEKNKNKKEYNEITIPPVVYHPTEYYNEDGTLFKGNGKVYFYADNCEGTTIEVFRKNIINGYTDMKDIDGGASHTFFTQLLETPPSVSFIPSDYTSSDISVKITNVVNNIDCSVNHGVFSLEKFYNDDKPGEYKLLEYMGEVREENGKITRLFYISGFDLILPEEGEKFIKGELSYTQILTDLHSGKTETADVKTTYDLDFGLIKGKDIKIYGILAIDKRVIYTILEEDSNNIHYKADITIGFEEFLTAEDRKIKKRYTLVDKYFRIK